MLNEQLLRENVTNSAILLTESDSVSSLGDSNSAVVLINFNIHFLIMKTDLWESSAIFEARGVFKNKTEFVHYYGNLKKKKNDSPTHFLSSEQFD